MSTHTQYRDVEEYEYPSTEVVTCPYPFYSALRDQAPAMEGMSGEIIRIHPLRVISFGLEGDEARGR